MGCRRQTLAKTIGRPRSLDWHPSQQLLTVATDSAVQLWDTDTGKLKWTAALLPESTAVFDAAGQLVHGNPEDMDGHIVYLLEKRDGTVAIKQPTDFNKQYPTTAAQD